MTCEYRIPLEQKHYVSLLVVHDIDNNTELSFSLLGLAIKPNLINYKTRK
jgi:hypothetical protein